MIDYIDEKLPEIYENYVNQVVTGLATNPHKAKSLIPHLIFLPETCSSLRDHYMVGELEWSDGEPTVNVYGETGYFGGGQKDHLALILFSFHPPILVHSRGSCV